MRCDTPTHKDEEMSDKLARLQRGKIICPLFYILLMKLRYNNRKFLGRGENDMKIIRDNCSVQLM